MPTLITRGAASAKAYGFGAAIKAVPPAVYAFTGNTAAAYGSGTTISVTIPTGGIPAGSAIYVFVLEGGVTVNGSVADNASTPNTYSLLTSQKIIYSSGTQQIYQSYNSNALVAGNTITYTRSTPNSPVVMSVMYVTGLMISGNPYDSVTLNYVAFNGGAQPGANLSGTPSVSGEVFLAVLFWWDTVTHTVTLDTANGWISPPPTTVSLYSGGGGYYIGFEGGYQINAGTGKLTTQPTISSVTDNTIGGTFIFGLKHK